MLRQNARFRFLSLVLLTWTASAITPMHARAQIEQRRWPPVPPASELLGKLERGEVRGVNIRSAFEMDRVIDDGTVDFGNYSQYTDAERTQFLDALERIAREGRDSDARSSAFLELFHIGASAYKTAPQAREVPRRLMRIYEQTTIRESRWAAIQNLGELLRTSPEESHEITDLLVSLVKQPVTTVQTIEGEKQFETEVVPPYQALDALIWACEAGVATLRRLHADRTAIPDRETRGRIDEMAKKGFDPAHFEVSTGWPQPCSDVPPHLQGR